MFYSVIQYVRTVIALMTVFLFESIEEGVSFAE